MFCIARCVAYSSQAPAPTTVTDEKHPVQMERVMDLAKIYRPSAPRWSRWPAIMLMVCAALCFVAPRVHAQDNDALKILKAMSDYLASQNTISVTFDSDIEVITSELQKIQFTSTNQLVMTRPDKLWMSRTGGYADVELFYNGKIATIFDKYRNHFAQADAIGSVDQLFDRLSSRYSVEAPGADLLRPNVYAELARDVLIAKHIGQGVVDGVPCEHLAFRNFDTDWQIWIETGPRPIPRKYIITTKTMTGAPQYTLVIRDWHSNVPIAADKFAFQPPANAKKVALTALSGIDEVPPGVAAGAKQ